ncbi:4-(cytidine 5'-diphospho)-2-C-methyl-D-erythritol kinase [Verrucomicrobiaceae bacterium R5-34]|nr:4-(cytidine 5'-diphospho)-2-C-methyl-D-erythritol kinase [Verrucomicrobiaceae bacterium R5-34]
MPSMTWTAPAKVNLYLKVLGRRVDGFHDLESLMVPLSLADHLHFEKADAFELCCDSPGVPTDQSNLVSKAVRIFQRVTGKDCHWRIRLEKNVPHGAGLGGGSSDAATALLALNELEQAGLSEEKLASMAAEIGSDIPFFIYRKICKIEGRGEVVRPVHEDEVPGLLGTKILLLKPSFGVSTPDAYKHCMTATELPDVDYAPTPMPWGSMINDLERPVFRKYLFLAELKMWLRKQPEVETSMMSGSGSTMMAILADASQSDAVIRRAREELDPTLWAQLVNIC